MNSGLVDLLGPNYLNGSGFCCLIPLENKKKKIPVLITCIKKETLLIGKQIFIQYDNGNQNFSMNLSLPTKIYSNDIYGITIIEMENYNESNQLIFMDIDEDIFNSKDFIMKNFYNKKAYILEYAKPLNSQANNQNCGKLLYIISEKLSFGKTPQPRKHEDEIILETKKQNQSYDCEYKKVNRDNSKNIDSIKNTNYANNLNYINNDHIINFKEFFSDTEGKNEQVLNSLKNDNLFPTNDDSEEDNDNIFIINDKSANDLIFLQKMVSMKDNWQL
jgi:hypothetical protein